MRRMPTTPSLRCFMAAPFLQLRDAPTWGKAWGGILAVVQYLASDLLTGLLGLLCVSGAVDYMYGRKVAQLKGEYTSLKAEMGLHSKILGILLILLTRAAEYWLLRIDSLGVGFEVNTHGVVAVALAVTLLAKEFDSVDQHRQALGGQPWPVFDQFLRFLRRFPTGLPAEPPEPPEEK